jgi:hypothetical protein
VRRGGEDAGPNVIATIGGGILVAIIFLVVVIGASHATRP